MARDDDADIVIGKVVGHGKSVPRNLFRRNRTGVDLQWDALVWLLTPHKLWRRTFLDAHELRFPEGPRRLEDHVFVMRAYFSEPRISVLADYPCYHWVLRDREVNASWGRLDWPTYFAFMAEVLDIVDEHTEPGPFRDRLYARWYRGKMLNRVEKVHSNPDRARRRPLYQAMHDEAVARFPESVDDFLPLNLRARSRLLRDGDYDGLEALADFETTLRAEARALEVREQPGGAELRLEAELAGLRFVREGDRVVWGDARLDATNALEGATMQLLLKRRATQEEYRVPAKVEPRLVDELDGVRVVLTASGAVIAATGAAGGPLPAALWEVHVVVIVAGFRAAGRVRRAQGSGAPDDRGDAGRPRRRAPPGLAAQPAPARPAAGGAGDPRGATRRAAPRSPVSLRNFRAAARV